MAVSFALVSSRPDLGRKVYDMTCDGSYASGGYAITAANVGMVSIDNITASDATGQGNVASWIPADAKLKVFQGSATASAVLSEAVSGDLSTSNVFRLQVTGVPAL